VIFHLDMDAFYAAIEQRDAPSLQGRPVIVGSPPNQRGVVCAASYEARKFGVRSAMPSSIAGRLCPTGIFVRPRMEVYREESHRIREILERTGAIIEPMSIDEAYLDLSSTFSNASGREQLYEAVPLAYELKRSISSERRLTASIGIASNKLLAKLASDFQKPNGLTLIPDRDRVLFLRPMKVGVLFGVGPVTAELLQRHGLHTIGDLQDYSGDLRGLVGSFADSLKRFARGEDDRPVDASDIVKSISSENTFLVDTEDRAVLRRCLREQAGEISGKMKARELLAKTIQVKVRYSDFSTLTRQVTVEQPVSEAADVYRLGCFLLARHRLVSRPLRLLGLGATSFEPAKWQQLSLALR
jgi:DNA polymerase-4